MTTRLNISLGATLNLGDFNSVRIDVGESTDVPEGQDVETARAELYARVEGCLNDKIIEVRDENGR